MLLIQYLTWYHGQWTNLGKPRTEPSTQAANARVIALAFHQPARMFDFFVVAATDID
jgi:hypothetical protein